MRRVVATQVLLAPRSWREEVPQASPCWVSAASSEGTDLPHDDEATNHDDRWQDNFDHPRFVGLKEQQLITPTRSVS